MVFFTIRDFQDVALVDGGNPESVSYVGEEIYFSAVPEDNQYFSIDRRLDYYFSKQAPDFESSKVIYEVTILVEEEHIFNSQIQR